MSLKLLHALNGNNDGDFSRYLNGRHSPPNICWYPSAGSDFRDLTYLNPAYAAYHQPTEPDPVFPDLFIHTDYTSGDTLVFEVGMVLHSDSRTEISIYAVEELPRLNLPVYGRLVSLPYTTTDAGRVFFLTLDVYSRPLEARFKAHLIYAFVENTAFCSEMLLRYQADVSHVLHIRYGGSFGGSKASGAWLRRVLDSLHCRLYLTDGWDDHWQDGDYTAIEVFPDLDLPPDPASFRSIRSLPSSGWSHGGDISWMIRTYVAPQRNEPPPASGPAFVRRPKRDYSDLQPKFYRVVRSPKSLTIPAPITPRPPGNVPYLIDNLWEWLRPDDHASRRMSAFASPTVELAAAGANGSVEDAWGVELLDGQTPFQIAAGNNPADARYHDDIRRLQKLVMKLLGVEWTARPAVERGPESVLFLPCATKSEIHAAIAASNLLDGDLIRRESSFWTDVTPFDPTLPPPHPSGEIFFSGVYRLVPLSA